MTGSITLQISLFSSIILFIPYQTYAGSAWSELTHLDGGIGVHEIGVNLYLVGFTR